MCHSFSKTNLLHDGPDPLQPKATFHLQEVAQIHVQLLKLKTVPSLVGEGVVQPDNVEPVRAQILDPVESRRLGGMRDMLEIWCECNANDYTREKVMNIICVAPLLLLPQCFSCVWGFLEPPFHWWPPFCTAWPLQRCHSPGGPAPGSLRRARRSGLLQRI